MQMSLNRYARQGREKLISGRTSCQSGTVDGYHARLKRKKGKPSRAMSCLWREGRSFPRLWNEAQTGHRLTKQKVRGHEFSAWADSVTAGQQLFLEVICEDPRTPTRCCVQVLKERGATPPGRGGGAATSSGFEGVNTPVINSVIEH